MWGIMLGLPKQLILNTEQRITVESWETSLRAITTFRTV